MLLRRTPLLIALVAISALVAFSSSVATDPVESEPTDYANHIAVAEAAAAEQSWARAREAYDAALEIAPDAEARRWAGFWRLDAAWRAEGLPDDWTRKQAWIEQHQSTLNGLLKAYPDSRSQDNYWLAVMQSRLDLQELFLYNSAHTSTRLIIADVLASHAPTAGTIKRYTGFVVKYAERPGYYGDVKQRQRWLFHLDRATDFAASNESRSRLMISAATLSEQNEKLPLVKLAERWAEAVHVSESTPYASIARTKEFLFLVGSGFAPEVAPNTSADMPTRLAEAQRLQERLKASLDTDERRNVSRLLERYIGDWDRPHVRFDFPAELRPGKPLSLRFGLEGYSEIRATLYRHTLMSWSALPFNGGDLSTITKWNKDLRTDSARILKSGEAKQVAQATKIIVEATDRKWRKGDLPFASSLESGFYTILVELEGEERSDVARMDVLVTSVRAMVVGVTSKPVTLLVSDNSSNEPISGAKVNGLIWGDDGKWPIKWKGELDQDGLMRLPKLPDSSSSGSRYRTAGWVGDQPIENSLYADGDDKNSFLVDLILDRPLYRPGETVFWKVVVREREAGRFAISRAKLYLSAGRNDGSVMLIEGLKIRPNAFGTSHGSFKLPDDFRPGQVSMAISDSPDFLKAEKATHINGAFTVDNFVAPLMESEITLTGGPNSLQPGREIEAQVNASYLSGGPVVGAPVEGRFSVEIPWFLRQEAMRKNPSFDAWMKSLKESSYQAVTDAEGLAKFELSLPETIPSGVVLSFKATVRPDGGTAIDQEASWKIYQTGYHVDYQTWDEARAVRPEDSVEFRCRVLDGRNEGVPFVGTGQLVEKEWAEAWLDPNGAIVTGEALATARRELSLKHGYGMPPLWKKLHAGYTSKVIEAQPVESDASGNLKATFTIPDPGIYHFQLKHEGVLVPMTLSQFVGFGWEQNSLPLSVVAADEKTQQLPLRPGSYLFATNKPYVSGQTLDLLMVTPSHFSSGGLMVRGETDYRMTRVEGGPSVRWITLTDLPQLMGVAACTLFSPSGEEAYVSVAAPDLHRRLLVAIEDGKSELRPGESDQIGFKVSEFNGKPTRAEIAFKVTDESIRQLVSEDESRIGPEEFLNYQMLVSRSGMSTSGDILHDSDGSIRFVSSVPDPRVGIWLNPSLGGYVGDDGAIETLSAFEVSGAGFNGMLRSNVVGRGMDGQSSEEPNITIRLNFSLTAAWEPEVRTGKDGEASVTVNYPDSLTKWRLEAYAVGADGNTFGHATTFTQTNLPLQARLQTPRSLVVGDRVDIGALLLNRTDDDLTATAKLEANSALSFLSKNDQNRDELTIAAQGESRASWTMNAAEPGLAELTLTARAGDHPDGVLRKIPVRADGFWQDTVATGRLTEEESKQTLVLPLPTPLDSEQVKVTVQYSLGAIGALLDGLPYLIDYPYGCVEQTMSRFLPALVVRQTLTDMGFSAREVEKRIMLKESTDDLARRESTAGLMELDDVIEHSLKRLAEAQQPNGGFGWWPGEVYIDPWMTAYVAWGLAMAEKNGAQLPVDLQKDARIALRLQIDRATATDDILAWGLAAITRRELGQVTRDSFASTFQRVLRERDQLTAYGRACLALAAEHLGSKADQELLLRNLENGAQHANAEGYGPAVHWGSAGGYTRAMDSAVESTALTLMALIALDPNHQWIEPAANWLLLNRRSARWSNTRDTAFAVMALAQYTALRGTARAKAVVALTANGQSVGNLKITRKALLSNQLDVTIPASLLRAGDNDIEVELIKGKGPLYALAQASAWAENETAKPAGHLLSVNRDFEHRVAEPTLAGTLRITSQPLGSDDVARAGETVVATVTLNVPIALEYVMVVVPKPAGCEPLNPLSGWDTRMRWIDPATNSIPEEGYQGELIYREEHDDRSVFFLRNVRSGTWEISYEMRAITPGDYRAAPVVVEAMYAPEARANTEASRVEIEPRI